MTTNTRFNPTVPGLLAWVAADPAEFRPVGGNPPMGNEVLIDFVTARQQVLEPQHNEIWTAYHHSCFPPFINPLHERLRVVFPESKQCTLQYTYWPHPPNVKQAALDVQKRHDVTTFVGSEYCQGLKKYTAEAIRQGVRFITSPIHSFQEHRRVETWMLETIEESLRQFEEGNA